MVSVLLLPMGTVPGSKIYCKPIILIEPSDVAVVLNI